MGKHEKTLRAVLSGTADANIGFEELCAMLRHFGFSARTGKGSHTVYFLDALSEQLNLQPDGRHAKPYQVRQVRAFFLRHRLPAP